MDASNDCFGSKWSLQGLLRYMQSYKIDTDPILRKIEDIVVKTIISVEPLLNNGYNMLINHKQCCFELLGFDILIDETYKPWLLEVNLSPSLNCDSPLDHRIKGTMLAEIFTLIGIISPIFSWTKTGIVNVQNIISNERKSEPKVVSSSKYDKIRKPPIKKQLSNGIKLSLLGGTGNKKLTSEEKRALRYAQEENNR
jgi:hypothetical protein